jgi:hypothetical protein
MNGLLEALRSGAWLTRERVWLVAGAVLAIGVRLSRPHRQRPQ